MGRNNIRADLEERRVTYVRVGGDGNASIITRLGAWMQDGISKKAFDFGLGAAGVGTAVVSVIFAGVMMTSDTSHPKFGGAEYLLLFTRPLHPVTPLHQQVAAAARHRALDVDYAPTGSIGSEARETAAGTKGTQSTRSANEPSITSRAAVAPRKDYLIKSVSGGVATINSPQGSFVVETGSLMPNGDLVVSIDRRAGHWVVVTSGGLIEAQ